FYGLSFFAVFYGLDWIATVPPTQALANKAFGEQRAPVIFGWISASHQMGAATAAALAGAARTASGSYLEAFVVAGGRGLGRGAGRGRGVAVHRDRAAAETLGDSLTAFAGKDLPRA